MAAIKTNGNTFEAFDQDQTASISRMTHNAHEISNSRWFIQDLMDTT